MFGSLAVQGPKRGGRPAMSRGHCLHSRLSGRSRTKAENKNGSHPELLSRMDGIGWLLRRTWASCTGGSRRAWKYSIAPGESRTSTNPTCGTSTRLMDLYSSYVCDFVLSYLFAVVSIYFLPAYRSCSCFPIFLGSYPLAMLLPVAAYIPHS